VGAALRVPGTDVLTGQASGSIARVTITGLIRGDQERVEALERLGKSRARAVIVHINSPGGTTSGSEQLHDSLMRLKEQKPLVVVVDGLAASGGYIAAVAADHIVALETSLVGSIGVLFQYPNVADLLKTLGVKIEEIKSSPLKAAPNGFEPTSPEARAAIESVVSDSYAWFKGMVKARRQLDDEMLQRVADGRVFTGRQGIPLKLVDELGDERTAIAWLAKEKNIDPKTPVRDYRLRDRLGDLPFLHTAIVTSLDAVGLGLFARRFEEWGAVQAIERLNLDGLLALWHPPTAN
jgi:protease-4